MTPHYPNVEEIRLPDPSDRVERIMQERITGATEDGWRCRCRNCGWTGPIRQSKLTATNDCDRHRGNPA